MAIMQQRGALLGRVMRHAEERVEKGKPMLEAWKQGYTEMEFRLMNGEDLMCERDNRNMIPGHCKTHDLWESTIVAHERQFQDLDDGGMPAASMIGAKEPTEWTVFFLNHKPSGNSLHRNLIMYSNGIMSTGYDYSGPTSGGCGGAWLPYYMDRKSDWESHRPMLVSDYKEHIEKIHQDGLDWIEKHFKDKPKVRQRMLDSLDEQINHDRFRGLHWKN
tara:strand:+ start:192 stop:845 length:654 start_codon:yes stop_codon:yes gene_type:complete